MLSIDPGTQSMGWAFWDTGSRDLACRPPDATGLIIPWRDPHNTDWWDRAVEQANGLLYKIPIPAKRLDVYCEMPVFFAGTVGGMAAAGTGSLQKLCFQVGCVAQAVRGLSCFRHFYPVLVNEWKGQLPKEVVIQRIKKLLGEKACKDYRKDMWDAVGIGLWARGVFK